MFRIADLAAIMIYFAAMALMGIVTALLVPLFEKFCY